MFEKIDLEPIKVEISCFKIFKEKLEKQLKDLQKEFYHWKRETNKILCHIPPIKKVQVGKKYRTRCGKVGEVLSKWEENAFFSYVEKYSVLFKDDETIIEYKEWTGAPSHEDMDFLEISMQLIEEVE